MEPESEREHILTWDKDAFLEALICSLVVESVSLAPLALSGMGHAGPDGLLGWLSLLLNFPGFMPVILLANSDVDMSWSAVIGVVFITQTALWCSAAFVFLRWRKVRA